MKKTIKIAPSILSADFACLAKQIEEAEAAGADYIHVDVMDGHFVPNITVGPLVVKALRHITSLPLDVHLMVEKPEQFLEEFSNAGADIITVHWEACPHIHRALEKIKRMGKKAGVSINPATPVWVLEEILDEVDLILAMTVNPGFGGQKLIPSTLSKVEKLKRMLSERGLATDIEVDGGINEETAPAAVRAGARILVAGAAVFESPWGIREALQRIRRAAEAALEEP